MLKANSISLRDHADGRLPTRKSNIQKIKAENNIYEGEEKVVMDFELWDDDPHVYISPAVVSLRVPGEVSAVVSHTKCVHNPPKPHDVGRLISAKTSFRAG